MNNAVTEYQSAGHSALTLVSMLIQEWKNGYIVVDDSCLETMLGQIDDCLKRQESAMQTIRGAYVSG